MLKSILRRASPCVLSHSSSCYFSTAPSFYSEAEEFEYQAETQRLLEIVTHSLYQNKEIFIRELISNSSDALEKRRQQEYVVEDSSDALDLNLPYEINLTVDSTDDTFMIADTGIGMTKAELEEYLGTICYSGSQSFQNQLNSGGQEEDITQLIGQFGVGFYSVFMVADEVEVISRSPFDEGSEGWKWSTKAGSPTFTIEPCETEDYGTSVKLFLKKEHTHYGEPSIVEQIVRKYSHFVSFPITMNDAELPSLDALWTRPRDQISEEEHAEFYQYLSKNPYESDPFLTIVFQTDMPIQIQSIFYIPQKNDEDLLTQMLLQQQAEELGLDAQSSGVELYSNKVLVSSQPGDVLPGWLRFVRGVVDSADFPINVSRETFQDSNVLISRIQSIVTKKILSELKKVMKSDRKGYEVFYDEYDRFLKEGVTTDYMHMEKIGEIMLFESALSGKRISLEEYVSEMKEGQSEIYYLIGTSRSQALSSPYIEVFEEKGIDVLFSYTPVLDDFVFETLGEHGGYPLVRADRAMTGQGSDRTTGEYSEMDSDADENTSEEVFRLCGWMEDMFPMNVDKVEVTTRLSSKSPAIVMNPESQTERMFKKMQNPGMELALDPQKIAINPSNKLIQKVASIVAEDSGDVVAYEVMEQVIDNALIHANLLEDPRVMVNRINSLLELMMEEYEK